MKQKLVMMVLILIAIYCCSACANNENESDMIEYESGIYYNKNWSDTSGTYSGESVIPDEKTALEVAKSIFDAMEKSAEAQEYVPQHVFYDNQDEIWIVSFWKDTNQFILGGDCSIAMRKEDGKVLRIWFGE